MPFDAYQKCAHRNLLIYKSRKTVTNSHLKFERYYDSNWRECALCHRTGLERRQEPFRLSWPRRTGSDAMLSASVSSTCSSAHY